MSGRAKPVAGVAGYAPPLRCGWARTDCGTKPTYRIRWSNPRAVSTLSCAEHVAWLRENRDCSNVERIEDYRAAADTG